MKDGKPKPGLIEPHGGYRKLKSFQVAQLAYDVTVRFCDRYIEKKKGQATLIDDASSPPPSRTAVNLGGPG